MGAIIVAIRRSAQILLSPSPDMAFEAGDTIVAAGHSSIVEETKRFIE